MCSSNSFWGENSWWWIIILLLLFGNGNTCGCDNGCGCDNRSFLRDGCETNRVCRNDRTDCGCCVCVCFCPCRCNLRF